MTERRYCRRCEDITDHRHEHDCAHGIVGAHMAGSERFVCADCGLKTHAGDPGAEHFIFQWDKRA